MTKITETQRAALRDAANGRVIAAFTAGKLIYAGLAEKDGGSGMRGYSRVKLTDAGRAALDAA